MVKGFMNVEEVLADETFQSWFSKENEEQVRIWESWMIANPDQHSLVQEAVTIMEKIDMKENAVPAADIEMAFGKLNEKLGETENTLSPVFQLKAHRNRWWMAAAAVLIIAGTFSFWKFSNNNKTSIETPYGQISKHQLPDGSEVMLNANSSITLGVAWDEGKDREVWLKGEAFFEVAKTTNKSKFTVHTDQGDIIVTGTQFNVTNRDNKTSVLLTEGSVILKAKEGHEIVMKPGDFVEMQGNQFENKNANEEAIVAWKQNKLIFEKKPIKEAIKIISDHYGVKISLANESIQDKTITGILPNNNLDDLLQAMEATTGFKITRKNKEIIISVISQP